jgi:HEPN domain-containing protein
LQSLSNLRVREAQILLRSRQYSGAYYLAGYAVECALKACIAKQFRRYDFPDKRVVTDSYTHDLKKLAVTAQLDEAYRQRAIQDELFRANWELSTLWSEESRYRTTDRATCTVFLDAIMEEQHGVLPWLTQLW